MQRVRQLLVRIHDGEFRCRKKQFVVGIFDLIDIVIGRVNLLGRCDRLPHRLPRLLVEIDGAVLLGFESTDDLVKVDVDIVRNRALEIRRKGVPDQTPVSRVDYRAEELREFASSKCANSGIAPSLAPANCTVSFSKKLLS